MTYYDLLLSGALGRVIWRVQHGWDDARILEFLAEQYPTVEPGDRKTLLEVTKWGMDASKQIQGPEQPGEIGSIVSPPLPTIRPGMVMIEGLAVFRSATSGAIVRKFLRPLIPKGSTFEQAFQSIFKIINEIRGRYHTKNLGQGVTFDPYFIAYGPE